MMIFKYKLNPHGYTSLELPIGATVLHAAAQDGNLNLWASVIVGEKPETRIFFAAWTGQDDVPNGSSHVATVLSRGGLDVVHVFEVSKC